MAVGNSHLCAAIETKKKEPALLRVKKIDKLLVQSFLPPFVVTFFIAQFVLVMQTLWVYVDDLAGKGLGFFLLVELISYMAVSMVPLALPIAVLLSSVMVMGNMAERYELSSLKSAGVSLWRVMRPLFFTSVAIAVFSFICSNYLIPVSNLKFKSRLYDIRKAKPALSLEEGVFNDDFQGYAIRIGKKLPDGRTIRDVMVYDHTSGTSGQLSAVVAREGEMFVTPDERFFVMHLRDGSEYMEPKPTYEGRRRNYPFVRVTFKEWQKVFDLSEFQLQRTDESLFKSHQTMLNVRQLRHAIDSIEQRRNDRIRTFSDNATKYFHLLKMERDTAEAPVEADTIRSDTATPDTSAVRPDTRDSTGLADSADIRVAADTSAASAAADSSAAARELSRRMQRARTRPPAIPTGFVQQYEGALDSLDSFIQTFPEYRRVELADRAKSLARSLHSQVVSTIRIDEQMREAWVKHVFELHTKFSMAVACILFLFIGAPMGAIVRKGGFGYPILISILFFMLFMIITIFSKNIAERNVIHPVVAAWLSCIVLFPIGLFLTWKAVNDSKLLNVDQWWVGLRRIFRLVRRRG